jgi:hypothetical protein
MLWSGSKEQGRRALSAKVKDSPSFPLDLYIHESHAPRTARAARTNCRRQHRH